MTRRRSRPHRERLDLAPETLARKIDDLDSQELQEHASVLLKRFRLTAEAPGMRIAQDTLAHTKPGGSAPRSTPLCQCGCPSARDHWEGQFNAALSLDAQWSHDNNAPMLLRRFRAAILRAAVDLDRVTKTPRRVTDATEVELPHERDEWIVMAYENLPPDTAAVLESARAGSCPAAAIRHTRRRNDLHPETGLPVPAKDDHLAAARQLRAEGLTQSLIAHQLGIAQSTVSRLLRNVA